MAVYQFSALSDGQAISFDPNADVLSFDQTAIAAADIRVHGEGSNLRLVYAESGKDVVLLGTTSLELTSSNITFAGGRRLVFGDNTTGQSADNSANSLFGTAGGDHLWGLGGRDTLNGGAGDDWLVGGTGQDNMTGGTGADRYVFVDTPFNDNYDRVHGFVSGTDEIWLRDEAFSNIGASGNFAGNDGRFYAAAGASSGHDADDRIVYNTSNGYLHYDADGSGAGRAMLIGILQGAPVLAASDIVVFGGEDAPPPSNTPTDGDDTLVGTAGNDTIDGLAGDDSISGLAGDDSLIGGAGTDTLDGGTGNDTFRVDADDVLLDGGGIDTVIAPGDWTLGSGFDNLILTGPPGGTVFGTGNELNNVITTQVGHSFLNGKGGNDTLIGTDGFDFFIFDANHGSDFVDGGRFGATVDGDWLNFQGLDSGVTIDFRNGTATSAYGTITFVRIENAIGSQAGDRLVADDFDRDLRGYHGDDTLVGGDGDDALNGGGLFFDQFGGSGGNDLILGNGGNDDLIGEAGADTLNGGEGNDTLLGEGESSDFARDVFVFDQPAGLAHADRVDLFASGTDELHLDSEAMPALGAAGEFAINDARFFAGTGANAGQDSSDRVVYNTDTGELWYDADGNGSGDAQLIATLQGAPVFAATDIVVVGESGPAPITGTSGDDTLVGTAGNDTIDGLAGNDSLSGLAGDDLLRGGAGSDAVNGGGGNDTLDGNEEIATLDRFILDQMPGAANADVIINFAHGGINDELRLDNRAMPDLGPSGRFSVNDSRFHAGFGANSGHDASDRVVYNTSTGQLWYDADGNGAIAAELIATLQGAPSLRASNFFVTGDAGPGPIEGTDGDDTLVGTTGNDQIWGGKAIGGDPQAGDDSLSGLAGDDRLVGGEGNDTLDGGPDADTMVGGLHDDVYLIDNIGDEIIENNGGGSHDIAYSSIPYTLPEWVNDLTLVGTAEIGNGNELANVIIGNEANNFLSGLAGNDTLVGAEGADSLNGGDGNDVLDAWIRTNEGDLAVDTLEGGLGDDTYHVSSDGDVILADPGGFDTVRARNTDWTLGAGLDDLILDDTVGAAFVGIGNELDNRIVGSSEGGSLFGRGGDDVLTLVNAFNFSDAHGGDGNDTLAAARDSELFGDAGDDVLEAFGIGSTMTGGLGTDTFVFDSAGGTSSIVDFASDADNIRLDATSMQQLGASGNFAAGDARYFAGGGANSGQDASDRVVYNSTTGQLWFDADGSGAGDAHLIATLQGAPALAATDIEVVNGAPSGSVINGTSGNDSLAGTDSNDTIVGFGGSDTLNGVGGDDWLEGGTGQDGLTGGAGADSFVFRETPFNTNYDRVFNFASGTDELVFDRGAYTEVGALGDFATGDGRFYAAAGAEAGHDADDRIIYNTSNGTLHYDADGSGAGREMFIGVLHGAPALDAADITII